LAQLLVDTILLIYAWDPDCGGSSQFRSLSFELANLQIKDSFEIEGDI
jgi:hypothetical protein